MATLALTNQYVIFNAVEFSDHTKSCTIVAEAEQLDETAMGDSWREYKGGLKSGTATLEELDDFASGSIDATVWAAFDANVPVAMATRPVNTTIDTTNPEYQFNVLPNQWNIGGSVGELAMKNLTYPITGAITRDVTA